MLLEATGAYSKGLELNYSGGRADKEIFNVRGAATYQTILSNGDIKFGSNNVIISGGNVGIGTTTPVQKLSVVGNAQFTAVTSGTYGMDLNLTTDGTLTTSASDERLKQNILVLDSKETLDKVMKLKPSSFDWKTNSSHDIGLIAQEVESIFPELVFTNPTDGYKGINYSRLPALLISAVQEIAKQIAGFAEEFRTKKLCVGETCITESELKQLLQNKNTGSVEVVNNGIDLGEQSNASSTGMNLDNTGTKVLDLNSTDMNILPKVDEVRVENINTDPATVVGVQDNIDASSSSSEVLTIL
jgi:hypothetical protein